MIYNAGQKFYNNGITLIEVVLAAVIGFIVLYFLFNLLNNFYNERKRNYISDTFKQDIELAFEYLGDGYFDTADNIRRVGLRDVQTVSFGAKASAYQAPTNHPIYNIIDGSTGYLVLSAPDKQGKTPQPVGAYFVGIDSKGKKGLIYLFKDSAAAWQSKVVIPSKQLDPLYDDLILNIKNPDEGKGGIDDTVKAITVTISLIRNAYPSLHISSTRTMYININYGSVPTKLKG